MGLRGVPIFAAILAFGWHTRGRVTLDAAEASQLGDKMTPMRKLWNLFSTLAAMAILATIMVTFPQTPLTAQGKGGGKNPPPKNLKVLTPENFMAQMQTFPAALGVENQGGCNFCHEADRSLDTKPAKVKARQMIELVTEINAKFGDGKVHVTCWTCHLGSTMPEIARQFK